jgi:hypothetical protein
VNPLHAPQLSEHVAEDEQAPPPRTGSPGEVRFEEEVPVAEEQQRGEEAPVAEEEQRGEEAPDAEAVQPAEPIPAGEQVSAAPTAGNAAPVRLEPVPAAPRPRIDAITAALRYPWLVILPMILLVPAAYVLATRKHPTYTAEAQVLMQQPAPTQAAALPGVVQAELSLSPVYARELQFDPVIVPLARRFHTTPAAIAARISATPVPSSPIIRIQASAGSSATAVALANAAAQRFSAFVTAQAQSSGSAPGLLQRYRQAAAAYETALVHQRQLMRTHSAGDPAVIAAMAATQVAQQREQTLASQYQAAAGSSQTTPGLGVFALAGSASSNRTSHLEIYLFAAAVAGLVIGLALATLVANRRLRARAPA